MSFLDEDSDFSSEDVSQEESWDEAEEQEDAREGRRQSDSTSSLRPRRHQIRSPSPIETITTRQKRKTTKPRKYDNSSEDDEILDDVDKKRPGLRIVLVRGKSGLEVSESPNAKTEIPQNSANRTTRGARKNYAEIDRFGKPEYEENEVMSWSGSDDEFGGPSKVVKPIKIKFTKKNQAAAAELVQEPLEEEMEEDIGPHQPDKHLEAPTKLFETILAYRIKPPEKEEEKTNGELGPDEIRIEEPKAEIADGPVQYEYLVKWKGLSYIHVEWISEAFILATRMGKSRLQRFHNKAPPLDNEYPFDENFTVVERIVDVTEFDGVEHTFVKWCNLPYSECTWEKSSDIRDEEARRAHELKMAKKGKIFPRKPRPAPASFQEVKDPQYKDGRQLRQYQVEGLSWLLFCWYNRTNSILGDEMGLGKTIQSVSIVDRLYRFEGIPGPFLIIVPLSTIDHWKREFERWTDMNTVVFHGSLPSRQIILDYEWYFTNEDGYFDTTGEFKFDVVITTYEILITNMNVLKPINWRYVIVDEAHRLKNLESKATDALLQLSYEHITLLTGTPIQNNSEELWTLLHVLNRKRFTTYDAFVEEFGTLTDATQIKKLQEVLKPFLLRRMKEDVEKTIAPKEETIIEVELTRTQKKYYKAILEKNFDHLVKGGKSNNMPSLMNVMVQLRNCCNHPFLLQGVEESELGGVVGKEETFKVLLESSGKMVLIDKLLARLKEGGHKVLIFSQMIRVLDILEDFLNVRGYTHERIDGRVRGPDRQAAIDRFSRPDSQTFVFLLCTRAGGLGINLTAADTAIIYDSDWNPQNDLQAQARCHRIGQEKAVKIYRLLTRNTYERDMFDRASKKLGLDHAILSQIDDQGDSGNKTSLTSREVDSLLKKGVYDLFNDDETNAFCEENIDQILSGRSETIVHKDEVKPSTFSKAHFTSSNAEPHLDVNDPDFWVKLMPEVLNKPSPEVLLTARQRRQATRLNITSMNAENLTGQPAPAGVFEGNLDDSADSDMDDFERGAPNKSQFPGRNRFQKWLLLYGHGRFSAILKATKDQRTPSELALYSYAFVKKVLSQIEPPLEDLEDVIKEVTIPEPDQDPEKPQIVESEAYLQSLAKYDTDLGLNDQLWIAQVKKNASLYYKRFQLLAYVAGLVSSDFAEVGPEWPKMTGEAPEWWTTEHDKDLFKGTVIHGFGRYDDMSRDPKLSFVAHAPAAANKQARKAAPGTWPTGKWLTHRFKQSVKRIKAVVEALKKEAKRKKQAEERWTKRDIQEFYKFILVFGLPVISTEPKAYDCDFIRANSKITKNDVQINKKATQWTKKSKRSENMKKDAFEAKVKKFELTYIQAQRVWEKICLFESLAKTIKPVPYEQLEGQLAGITVGSHKKNASSFPSWWEPIVHDRDLVTGTIKYGFGKWDLMFEDSSLVGFHEVLQKRLAEGITESTIVTEGEETRTSNEDDKDYKEEEKPEPEPEPEPEGEDGGEIEMKDKIDGEDGETEVSKVDGDGDAEASKVDGDGDTDLKADDAGEAAKEKPQPKNPVKVALFAEMPKEKQISKRLESIIKVVKNSFKEPKKKTKAPKSSKSSGDGDPPAKKRKKNNNEAISILAPGADGKFTPLFSENLNGDVTLSGTRSNRQYLSPLVTFDTLTENSGEGSPPPPPKKKGGSKKRKASDSATDGDDGRPVTKKPRGSLGPKNKQAFQYDEKGEIVLPIKLGVLTVVNLGAIGPNHSFYSDKYIWPVGYVSIREYVSTLDVLKKTNYTNTIAEKDGKPWFTVTPDDDPTNSVSGRSASMVWTKIVERINIKKGKTEGSTKIAVSGPDLFGFGIVEVAELLSKLPGAASCTGYRGPNAKSKPARGEGGNEKPANSKLKKSEGGEDSSASQTGSTPGGSLSSSLGSLRSSLTGSSSGIGLSGLSGLAGSPGLQKPGPPQSVFQNVLMRGHPNPMMAMNSMMQQRSPMAMMSPHLSPLAPHPFMSHMGSPMNPMSPMSHGMSSMGGYPMGMASPMGLHHPMAMGQMGHPMMKPPGMGMSNPLFRSGDATPPAYYQQQRPPQARMEPPPALRTSGPGEPPKDTEMGENTVKAQAFHQWLAARNSSDPFHQGPPS